jgi:glyoxylase-like metal-dependent hydrolase (beta-lactamase superfamily II)
MRVVVVPVTPFQQNCSLAICEATRRAALIDPGGDLDVLLAQVEKQGVTLEKVLLTHGHIDHCGGTAELQRCHGLPVEGPHAEDRFWIDQLPSQSRMFGFPPLEAFTPDRWLVGGDTVRFGEVEMAVRFCPGHTPGHVIFFHGSIGRTDFPRGDHDALIHSITTQLWPLGDDVTFVPGHGPLSTVGAERRNNPFVGDRALGRL